MLHRPESLTDALALLGRGCIAVAGGTDLYPALRDGPPPPEMVDLTRVDGLRGITQSDGGWRIGGATTWTDILRADLPPLFGGLKAAAREVGSVQIQNAGTVAGNLCNASPAADGVPALLALDAEVSLVSGRGPRRMALADFLRGPRLTELRADEVLEAIHIPNTGGCGAFLKLGARRYLVISIAMASAVLRLETGRIANARIAVGACSPVAARLPGLELSLRGQALADARPIVEAYPFSELTPIDDIRATAAYRRDALVPLVGRVVTMAMEGADVA